MIYEVIDTNVIVSAYITTNKNSATSQVLQHIVKGDIVPIYNDEILDEYKDVLSRKKFHLPYELVEAFLNIIIEQGIQGNRIPFNEDMPDEDDRVFLEITLSQEDSFLVTGNLKHYPKLPEVISPAEFIRRFFENP